MARKGWKWLGNDGKCTEMNITGWKQQEMARNQWILPEITEHQPGVAWNRPAMTRNGQKWLVISGKYMENNQT